MRIANTIAGILLFAMFMLITHAPLSWFIDGTTEQDRITWGYILFVGSLILLAGAKRDRREE